MTESFAELFCGVFAAGGILMYPLGGDCLVRVFLRVQNVPAAGLA